MARLNIELNRTRQLQVIQAAIGERSGTLAFNRGLDGQVDDGSGQWGRVEVRALSIDHFMEIYGVPDVVFMDVEGFESAALRGTKRALQFGPDWLIEVHTGSGLEKLGGSVERLSLPFH